MRVCMVAYTYYETDNRVMRYAEALAGRGDEVDVVALRSKGQSNYEIINGVHVYRIQRRVMNEVSRFAYLAKIVAFLINSGAFVTWKHLRKKYDLIHVHSVPDFEVFAALIPKLSGAQCILDIHDIVPEFYAGKFGSSKESLLFKALVSIEKASSAFSNHVIVANHIWEKRLLSRSVREGKCSVFLNYPDQSIFGKRERRPQNDRFIMIYPGTLSWHQGVDIAIKAMALIRDKAPHAEFHIYGGGHETENLMRLTRELDLTDRIRFQGFVPLSQVADVMAASDLGVVPKRADAFGDEAFSTKIFEFMSLGVPVLAAATTIDRYYFNDSLLQFFKSGDEVDLAERMLALINDKPLRDRLVANALRYISENNWDVHRQRYFDLVDRLVSKT